jgi:hypothetical protein
MNSKELAQSLLEEALVDWGTCCEWPEHTDLLTGVK